MDIPPDAKIHPGDNWFILPHPIPPTEIDDSPLRSAGFANVIIRRGTKPHYRVSHSFLYQVERGQGYLVQGERDEKRELVRWHARYIKSPMMVSIDAREPHFFITAGEDDLHLVFAGSLSQCLQHDRIELPLGELEKPVVLHIPGKVVGYEGTTCNIILDDGGTRVDLRDFNRTYGLDQNLEPGQVVLVDMSIDWLGERARGVADEAQTTGTPSEEEGGEV